MVMLVKLKQVVIILTEKLLQVMLKLAAIKLVELLLLDFPLLSFLLVLVMLLEQ